MRTRSSIVPLLLSFVLLPTPPAAAANRSATKTFAEPVADQALVYLIREKRFQGGGRTMFVYADQQFLGTLDNDSYTFAFVEPGERLLWLNWAKINKTVTLEAGQTYYFNLWGSIDELDETTAQAFLAAITSYATPAADESAKSVEHIRDRFGKAQQVAAAKPADEPERAGSAKRREEHVAEWPKGDLAAYDVLCIEDFPMADPKAGDRKKGYLVETAPKRLADALARNLAGETFQQVLRNPTCSAVAGAAILRGRFTQYKPGSETARLMVAGAGSAQLEMELEILGGATGDPLVRLPVDRTWAWGGAAGASRGIEEMEKNLAYELSTWLRRARGAPDQSPPSPESAPAPES